ncbi:beta-1,3-glucan-binding protein-like [Dreissena polymorpha]|uniref:Uncharacterized protein n=1 Tax=Dreissena polymorpha TaxID=45954 RepID=A0A9D4E6W1_DREPO|nr:beta-1,3-glucan-binding protein-like [Dreissena polymorpha]XP_052232091.1 beta-1,3-glucan-binding protein-like [Dreissena polymorpha]KAH3775029.1 hypothetical protein DPMN_176425 [Dreissena polymorpha]
MLRLCVAVVVVVVACALPQPNIKHLKPGGFEVSVDDVPGLQWKRIKYVIDGKAFSEKLHQSVDGTWKHHKNDGDVTSGRKIKYTLVGTHNGKKIMKSGSMKAEQTGISVLPLDHPRRQSGTLVFRDDFDGAVDTSNWDYEISMYGGYNWEIQVYTNDPLNVFTRNGHLFLKPTLTSEKFNEGYLHTGTMDVAQLWGRCTNADRYGCVRHGRDGLLPPVMSGKITSKKTIRFGRVNVRARVPQGDWIWPAIWMLPRDSRYGGWPASGEIDLMESRGNSVARAPDGNDHGRNEIGSTLHWGPDAGQNKFYLTHGERDDNSYSNSFHVYSLDWTVDHIIILVDNIEVLRVNIENGGFWQKGGFGGNNPWSGGTKAAPFDQAFYLILNVAIGGTNGFFPDDWTYNSRKPWNNNSPTEPADFWNHKNDWLPSWQGDNVAMEVDYVEMFQY